MGVECRLTHERLARSAGEISGLGRLEPHVRGCLRCQAEAVRYRKLARHLAGLARVSEVAPPGILDAVARQLGEPLGFTGSPPRPSPATRTAAFVGTLAAAAGTAVVVRFLRTRSAA